VTTATAKLAPSVERSALDRVLAAYPLVVAYLVLLTLYAWQSTKHSTPWLFTDELQWAGLSRGVAHHGHPQLRLHNQGFVSLYAYFLAPSWWFGATSSAYAAAKYLNAAAMTASLFPAFALARLFVPRWAALACGIATAAIPSLVYTAMLIPESLAYFWSTLTLWLIARALLARTRWAIALATAAVILAPVVRAQLQMLILTALLATAITEATGRRGRALIGSWSVGEKVRAVVLCFGIAIWLGALATHHSYVWQIGTYFHHRMFTYGLWAIGAFVIGTGLLPAFASLAWLFGARFRLPDERVLGALLIGAVFSFGIYTAVKASYISTNFAIRVEERNLIYISPVVFVVAARWLVAGRARVVPVALAAGAVAYLLNTTPYELNDRFYSDAPGLSILHWFNRKPFYFTTTDLKRLIFGILIALVALAFVRTRLRRAGVAIAGALAVLVVAWNLTGEIASAGGSNDFSKSFRGVLPTPPDWIDRETGRARTLFIGEALAGSNAFWSLEFWNQSINDVWSVDSSAPGPGPTVTPDFSDLSGTLRPQLPVNWVVASPGVDPVGRLAEPPVGGLHLYHVSRPVRIADAEGGITPDGWMSTAAWYYHFAPNGARAGTAVVTLSRTAACGDLPSSRITIRVTRLRIDADGQPAPGKLEQVRRLTLRSNPCLAVPVRIPVRTPFRVDVSAVGTFQPSPSDQRQLSAQLAFGFEPK
jgi:hypothetical protein